jgi:hypothetical protein
MYEGRLGWSARERVHALKLQAAFANVAGDATAEGALSRLVYGAAGARLNAVEPVLPSLGPQAGNTGLDALLHLARYADRWRREPEDWTPPGGTDDAREWARSLAAHLFAEYPTPDFLLAAWFSGCGVRAEEYRDWWVHLAGGGKLEQVRFPAPMTHRAAHFFLLAPDDFSIPSALRYGQIRALNGPEALARAASETFLSDLQPDEPFWLSVLQFFVNHPRLPLSQFGPVADYARFRRYGTGKGDAPEPTFAMKGRTPDALLKRVAEWHETLARLGKRGRQVWSPSGIAPLDREEADTLSPARCRWQIVEITETLALAEEGREMRHCVRTYQEACVEGKTSIWSLRLTLSDNPQTRRLLTIEVNNHRRAVVQVRAKCNQTLNALRGNRRMMQARDVLKAWAYARRLGIGCSL